MMCYSGVLQIFFKLVFYVDFFRDFLGADHVFDQ